MIPAGDRRQPSAGEAGHTGTGRCEPAVGIGHFGSSAIEISTNGNPTGGPTMSSPSNRGHCLEVGHRSPPFRSTNITSAGTNGGRGGPMSVAGPPLARPSQASTRPRRKPGHDGRDFRQRRTTEESGSGPHQIRFSAPGRNSHRVAPDRTRVRTRLIRRRSQRPGPAPTRDPQSGHRPDDHYAGADLCALWTGDSVPVLLRQRDHARKHGQSDPRQARGPRRQSSGGGDLTAILRITPMMLLSSREGPPPKGWSSVVSGAPGSPV